MDGKTCIDFIIHSSKTGETRCSVIARNIYRKRVCRLQCRVCVKSSGEVRTYKSTGNSRGERICKSQSVGYVNGKFIWFSCSFVGNSVVIYQPSKVYLTHIEIIDTGTNGGSFLFTNKTVIRTVEQENIIGQFSHIRCVINTHSR